MTPAFSLSREVKRCWADSPALTATCVLMLVAFLPSVAGIYLDPRVITGVPAWLKPAKFAISTAIYAGTIAWLFRYISIWPRFKRAMGDVLAAMLILEVLIIYVQAARGTTSHFNVGTPLDATLFTIMGISILMLWLASVGVLVTLFRQRFADRSWAWALRLGMLIAVIGAATGGLMVRPSAAQSVALTQHRGVVAVGGHTVGAPDGGAGLPGLGWSTRHGDLRVPHFFGLHALQVIPLAAWLIRRQRTPSAVFALAGSYLVFIALLAWQALHGQSIVSVFG
jgi:hypothetical protein